MGLVGVDMGNGRIVVGVDGSSSSADALRWAANQATLTGDELHVVTAWHLAAGYGYAPIATDFDWLRDRESLLDEMIEKSVPAERRASVHKHVAEGHPAEVLLDAAEGAQLLVVGSRGHGGFTGMLLGSVSQHLVTHARCPVVVVHTD
jgi:nucleotide-binding universal stress UspA family protein